MSPTQVLKTVRWMKDKPRLRRALLTTLVPETPDCVKRSAAKARLAQHICQGGSRKEFFRQEARAEIAFLNKHGSSPQ